MERIINDCKKIECTVIGFVTYQRRYEPKTGWGPRKFPKLEYFGLEE